MSFVNTEIADKYQEFFNFMNQEHNLLLTIEEMDEIVFEVGKLVNKLNERNSVDEGENHSNVKNVEEYLMNTI